MEWKGRLTTLGKSSSSVDLARTLEIGETLAEETTVKSVARGKIAEGACVEGVGFGGCNGGCREKRSVAD